MLKCVQTSDPDLLIPVYLSIEYISQWQIHISYYIMPCLRCSVNAACADRSLIDEANRIRALASASTRIKAHLTITFRTHVKTDQHLAIMLLSLGLHY